MKTLLVLLFLCGCANVRPAAPGPRATTSVVELRRHNMETRWLVTVNNPTSDDVFIDCDEARIRIKANSQVDVLLVPDDQRCDLKNDIEYASLPGRMSKAWGRMCHLGVSP